MEEPSKVKGSLSRALIARAAWGVQLENGLKNLKYNRDDKFEEIDRETFLNSSRMSELCLDNDFISIG